MRTSARKLYTKKNPTGVLISGTTVVHGSFDKYSETIFSDIKEKLLNINNNSKKDTKEKMASSIATSQSQAPQGDFSLLKN